MEMQDDRTTEERDSHYLLVVATDKFMSGWGRCGNGGTSYAAWATDYDHVERVRAWVSRRGEMKRVRIVTARKWKPRGHGHAHIYVVREGHSSLNR